MKKKIRRIKKKVAKPAKYAIAIWRTIVATILFTIIAPTFLTTHTKDAFYPTMLIITVLIIGLVIIIQKGLRNQSLKEYLTKARTFVLIGAVLLAIAAYIPITISFLPRAFLLLGSAAFYSLGAQRLGLGVFFLSI